MILESVSAFVNNPLNMLLVVVSVLLGVFSLVGWKKYSKPILLYTHLFFILSPLFYFALSINCSLAGIQGLLSWCTALFAKFVLYLLPPLMALSFIVGYLIIPKLYRRISKPLTSKEFSKLCSLTNIDAKLFLIDKAKPVAFAVGRNVFVSVGLFELLSKNELEAVLLHELYHVKARSSWNKFSSSFVKFFSPVAWFSKSPVDREECSADLFAVKLQKTDKYLLSAKNKVCSF